MGRCRAVYHFTLLSSLVLQVGTLPQFLDEWKSIISNSFTLNIVKGHNLKLRCHPLLFCNYKQFNIKAAIAHHPVIQKDINKLLAKCATEPSASDAGFYLSMFVVPKHMGALHCTLNLK